ncbi:MAG: antiterminator Q family protein [Pantoea sp.]|uniref:antiterminator Q family protein n=1 Tax=Pantoea sp. TaxID=69393 RepID=UPI0029048779|nr:antiterminator Q family protein [Pantoea sp.]MDU1575404.1 antiterminator Q family protein [Pantoea sp.]
MRDMSQVLERWAGWAKTDYCGIDYSSIAAGFKGLLPQNSKMSLSCSDNDGLIIDGCIARLKSRRPEEHSVLVLFYIFGISKRKIANKLKKDEKLIRIEIQLAEGFIEGCLSMLDLTLDMDPEVKTLSKRQSCSV